jgi:hypothetical protein
MSEATMFPEPAASARLPQTFSSGGNILVGHRSKARETQKNARRIDMNDHQLDTGVTNGEGTVRLGKFSKLEAHLIGVGALAAALGMNWLFGLHWMDKAGTSLYWGAVLVYFAVLADSRKAK